MNTFMSVFDSYTRAAGLPDAVESQMFGKPCFKINGKAFVCFFNDCMVFKLRDHARTVALSLDGACLFDPSGKNRPMKEWIQMPFAHSEYWPYFAEEAFRYVNNSE